LGKGYAMNLKLAQLELVAGLPDAKRWPDTVAYIEAITNRASFAPNLTICRKIVKEKIDLSV
jgi:hypothetical protein